MILKSKLKLYFYGPKIINCYMKKIYLLLTFIGILCFSITGVHAQANPTSKQDSAERVEIYPNPNSGNTLFIISESGKTTTVSLYNILGERVSFEVLTSKRLDISALPTGVYILRIKIGKHTSSRKFIRN